MYVKILMFWWLFASCLKVLCISYAVRVYRFYSHSIFCVVIKGFYKSCISNVRCHRICLIKKSVKYRTNNLELYSKTGETCDEMYRYKLVTNKMH